MLQCIGDDRVKSIWCRSIYQKIIYLKYYLKKIILMSKQEQIKTNISMQVLQVSWYPMIPSSSNFTIVLLVVRVQ